MFTLLHFEGVVADEGLKYYQMNSSQVEWTGLLFGFWIGPRLRLDFLNEEKVLSEPLLESAVKKSQSNHTILLQVQKTILNIKVIFGKL